MSFGFGNTAQNAFGAAAKPTGFGAPLSFGTSTASALTPSFGAFGSSFGAPPAQAAPVFGTSFGTPSANPPPAFGSTFGNPAANAAPSFGSSFGTQASAAPPPFGASFGAQSAAPTFGTQSAAPTFGAQSAAPTFGTQSAAPIFGAQSATSAFGTQSAAPAFGAQSATSTFGTQSAAPTFGAQPAAPTFGGAFGSTPGSAPSLFGATATSKPSLFGATPASSLFSTPSTGLFGGTTTTQATSLFGANTSATTNLFGATATSTPSLFGTNFGTATSAPSSGLFGNTSTTPGTGFSLFGNNTATTSSASLFPGFGTATSAPTLGGFGTSGNAAPFGGLGSSGLFGAKPPTPQDSKTQQTLASFYAINVFGDERDDILKKWNMLQACWGTGKGFYSLAHPPIEYDHCNPFYRFKAVSYIVIPQTDNSDGLVKLLFGKKESDVTNQKAVILNYLNLTLGNKPNLTVTIIHIKSVTDSESEMMITVSEKGVTGTSKIIHSIDLATFLNQPSQKQQLSSLGITYIGPYIMPSKAQLEEYLKEPPPGIDIHMWQAAQADNPQPERFLPSPICGFTNLKKRTLCEEYETGLHRAFLQKVNNDIVELKKKHSSSLAQIAEQKQKFLQLQHRVLRILVKQETTRKVGIALQPEEEILRARLEVMNTHLNVPSQFRGKINELYSSTRVASSFEKTRNENYVMDQKVQDDIKQFLQMEQNGISHLIQIINKDLKDLKIISEGLTQMQYKQM